jgi:hypothetical protein
MYVKSIESNAKGLDSKPIELGPKTLILGPSGSGKSRIINVIELALTGRCSDIAGKDRSLPADLLALAPQREGKLWAQATLSDGSVARWETESQGPGSAKTPVVQNTYADKADQTLPLRALAEAIGGKPDKARRFFLRHATGQVTIQDVLSRLPPAIGEHFAKAARGMDPIDALLTLRDDAHEKHLAARTQATAAESVVNAAAPTVPRPTEAQLAQAQDAVSAAGTVLEAAIRAEEGQRQQTALAAHAANDTNRRRELQAALAELTASRTYAADGLRVWQEQLAALPVPDGQQQARAARGAALLLLSDWQTGKAKEQVGIAAFGSGLSLDPCALCGSIAPLVQLQAQQQRIIDACAKLIDGTIDGAKRAEIEKAVAAWKQHHADLDAQVRTAEGGLRSLSDAPAGYNVANTFNVTNGVNVNGASVSEARTKRDAAQREVSAMHTANAAWAQTSRMRTEGQGAAETRDAQARIRDACQQVADELLASSIKQFEAKVQKYLPAADVFAMRLNEGKREVFQLGLLRDGTVHSALSGAEWARVTAAVAAAITDGTTLSVIIPEERAYDPVTLATVMRALTGANAQVILTSPVRFAGRAPAGWTIVEVAPAAANAAPELTTAGTELTAAGTTLADANAQLGARGPVDPTSLNSTNPGGNGPGF